MSSKIDATFQSLCEAVNTPRSLALWLLFSSKELSQFLNLSVRAEDYLESQSDKFRDDYLCTEYLSKYKGLDTGIDTRQVALAAFTTAEDQCKSANLRIRSLWTPTGRSCWDPVFHRAQLKIQSCLGYAPKFAKMIDRFRWGSGATATLKGVDSCLDSKLCEKQISVTRKALPYLRAAMATDYAWLRARGIDASGPTSVLNDEFLVVQGSRGLTVSKNAKTDRFIAAEPTGNIFLQLGVGSYIRKCLKRSGIDLDDQTINQSLARSALDLGLATVDLKAASDTISSAIVWHLLPHSWATFLDALRSENIVIDDELRPLEKFSSMGNGFTFELESLIFWALVESLRDLRSNGNGRVSVYGDDIICPSELYEELRELLDFCGFTTNVKKTHASGLFRESCGKHYFGGKDVTPIYQKEIPSTKAKAYRFHNRLLYHAVDRGSYVGSSLAIADRRLLRVIRTSRSVFKQWEKVHRIPVMHADVRTLDGGVVSTPRQARDSGWRWIPGRQAWRCQTLCFFAEEKIAIHDAYYALALRATSGRGSVLTLSEPFTGNVAVRNGGGYRTQKRFFPESRDLLFL